MTFQHSETCIRRRLKPSDGSNEPRVNFGQLLTQVIVARILAHRCLPGNSRFKETWKTQPDVVRDPNWISKFKRGHRDVEQAMLAFRPLLQRWSRWLPVTLGKSRPERLAREQMDEMHFLRLTTGGLLCRFKQPGFERMSDLAECTGWNVPNRACTRLISVHFKLKLCLQFCCSSQPRMPHSGRLLWRF